MYVASLFIRQRLVVARGGGLTVAETPALPQSLKLLRGALGLGGQISTCLSEGGLDHGADKLRKG